MYLTPALTKEEVRAKIDEARSVGEWLEVYRKNQFGTELYSPGEAIDHVLNDPNYEVGYINLISPDAVIATLEDEINWRQNRIESIKRRMGVGRDETSFAGIDLGPNTFEEDGK